MILRIDYESLAYDIDLAIAEGADEAIKHFLSDAKSGLKSDDQEIDAAFVDYAGQKITAACTFYAQSILNSYGRGSLMDTTNPYLSDYIGNTSIGWNPVRKGTEIVGRKQGVYTNFFGEKAFSKGNMEGLSVEYMVKPISPSYAIQNAEKKLEAGLSENGYVMRIMRKHIDSFFNSIDYSKYFYYE